MADAKDVSFWVVGVGAVATMLTMAASFMKTNNNTKELGKFKKDLKKEVGDTMSAQNTKIEKAIEDLDELKDSVPILFIAHEQRIKDDYMTRPEVDAQFDRQDKRFDSQEKLISQQFDHITKEQGAQTSQINNIFKLLTDMRSAQIEDLKADNRELRHKD